MLDYGYETQCLLFISFISPIRFDQFSVPSHRNAHTENQKKNVIAGGGKTKEKTSAKVVCIFL